METINVKCILITICCINIIKTFFRLWVEVSVSSSDFGECVDRCIPTVEDIMESNLEEN